jgi:hypothetical protein
MLDININAKNHPDWDAAEIDESPRDTWVDAMTDNLMQDRDMIIDAIADSLDDVDNRYLQDVINGIAGREPLMIIGAALFALVEDYCHEIAERQWEALNE